VTRESHGESYPAKLKRYRFQLCVVVVSVLVAETGYRSGVLDTVEYVYSDVWHRASGARFSPEHVALVVVDDKSLAEHPDDPMVFWTPLFARAARTLRDVGARVIGIDFLFAITPEDWIRKQNLAGTDGLRDYDLAFRQELNSAKVVLAGAVVRGGAGESDGVLLAHSDYLLSLPNTDFVSYIGFADLMPDRDGGIRRYEIAPRVNLPADVAAGAPRVALGALLAIRASGLDAAAHEWKIGNRTVDADRTSTITYAGPPGTITRVSLSQVLAAGAVDDPAVRALSGKVVIVGGDFQGMNDVHSTPYSGWLIGRSGGLMSGVEIQANIVETIMSGRATEAVPAWLRWLLFSIFAGFTTGVYQKRSPWAGLGVLAGAAALALLVAFGAFQQFWLVPAAHLQAGLLTAYTMAFGVRLTREERDKARVKAMFKGYVSDSVVDMLLSSDRRLDLEGQSMRITVLFSDIRHFTTISEKLTARETVEFLNAYFAKAIAVVLEEGGRIDKFIGDALMAEFGVPYPFPDHATRALRAAVRLRQVAEEFQKWMRLRFPNRDLPEFAIGIGLHTGDAVVGNLGSEVRMEYTAIGDTVNVASRLEGETKRLNYAIAASAEVLQEAGTQVHTGLHETITVKGRMEPIEVHEVIDIRA
jgi:class 3 adenylate cyclase/CHASE2 domain-containing sensor protein